MEKNHEFLSEISLLELISSICKFLRFDSSIVPEDDIEAYRLHQN